MDRFTYGQLRLTRAELHFPPWNRLQRTDRHRVKLMTIEELVSKRTFRLLANSNPDALQPFVTRGGKNDWSFREWLFERKRQNLPPYDRT